MPLKPDDYSALVGSCRRCAALMPPGHERTIMLLLADSLEEHGRRAAGLAELPTKKDGPTS
jgi:hypothetical protein